MIVMSENVGLDTVGLDGHLLKQWSKSGSPGRVVCVMMEMEIFLPS